MRYEWAIRADQRVNGPASSPVSDALFFLDENVPTNASTGLPGSLQYYLAILEQNAVGSTYKKTLGSGCPRPGHWLLCLYHILWQG